MRNIRSPKALGVLAWYAASVVLLAITLGIASQEIGVLKMLPMYAAFLSMIYPAGCWFCKQATKIDQGKAK